MNYKELKKKKKKRQIRNLRKVNIKIKGKNSQYYMYWTSSYNGLPTRTFNYRI
jgi:hypothetical protein